MRSIQLVLLASMLLLSATAGAKSSTATARARFEYGQALYRSGRYQAASAEFRQAFEIDPQPKYLYNAAQALRRAGDCSGALELYDAFRRIAPDVDSSAAAARNMERCTPTPPPEPASEAEASAATPDPPAPPPPLAPLPPPPAAVEPTVIAVAPVTAPRPWRRARGAWLFAVGGASTGASLLTASILESVGASRFDQLSHTCAPRCTTVDVAPLRRQLDAATAVFVVAGVLATATVIALVVTRVHAHAAR